ncbi:MAG: hypothetical protein M3066_12550 [Actinomycetota bacterium]|nr:hypothetical protein [Actinomycetota bacterium]
MPTQKECDRLSDDATVDVEAEKKEANSDEPSPTGSVRNALERARRVGTTAATTSRTRTSRVQLC